MKHSSNKQFSLALRILLCIVVASLTLYMYIEKQNELTELRLAIPALSKEVKSIQEENNRLRYEIDRLESPIVLMEVMNKPEFTHLKYPYLNEEIFLPKGPVLKEKD